MCKSKKWIYAALLLVLCILLTVLTKTVDVAESAVGMPIGLSGANLAMQEVFPGVNTFWYTLTELLGYGAILIAAFFALVGLIQLIRRKNFFKVDHEILALGGLYTVTIALYVIFEKVIVNYRPVLMPGCETPEASFPSSHSMLLCVVMGSCAMIVEKYIKKDALRRLIQILCIFLAAFMICGRLFSGVHWLSDIVASILISSALLILFSAVLDLIRAHNAASEEKTL